MKITINELKNIIRNEIKLIKRENDTINEGFFSNVLGKLSGKNKEVFKKLESQYEIYNKNSEMIINNLKSLENLEIEDILQKDEPYNLDTNLNKLLKSYRMLQPYIKNNDKGLSDNDGILQDIINRNYRTPSSATEFAEELIKLWRLSREIIEKRKPVYEKIELKTLSDKIESMEKIITEDDFNQYVNAKVTHANREKIIEMRKDLFEKWLSIIRDSIMYFDDVVDPLEKGIKKILIPIIKNKIDSINKDKEALQKELQEVSKKQKLDVMEKLLDKFKDSNSKLNDLYKSLIDRSSSKLSETRRYRKK